MIQPRIKLKPGFGLGVEVLHREICRMPTSERYPKLVYGEYAKSAQYGYNTGP